MKCKWEIQIYELIERAGWVRRWWARSLYRACWLLAFGVLTLGPASRAAARSLEETQLLHSHLHQRINQNADKHPSGNLKTDYRPYVRGIRVMAKDRDEALAAAQEAQASDDPDVKAFFDKFMDLVEMAQDFGNGDLKEADMLLRIEDDRSPFSHSALTLRARRFGKPIYDEAGRLEFDQNITRQQVRRMLSTALKDLDTGWTLTCGAGVCGHLYPTPQRDPYPKADEGLVRGIVYSGFFCISDLCTPMGSRNQKVLLESMRFVRLLQRSCVPGVFSLALVLTHNRKRRAFLVKNDVAYFIVTASITNRRPCPSIVRVFHYHNCLIRCFAPIRRFNLHRSVNRRVETLNMLPCSFQLVLNSYILSFFQSRIQFVLRTAHIVDASYAHPKSQTTGCALCPAFSRQS